MKAIGFWHSIEYLNFPDPAWFIDHTIFKGR